MRAVKYEIEKPMRLTLIRTRSQKLRIAIQDSKDIKQPIKFP